MCNTCRIEEVGGGAAVDGGVVELALVPVHVGALHVVVRHGDGLDDAVLGGLVGLVDEAEGGRQEEEVLHVAARPGVRVRRRQRQVLVGVDA